MIFFILDIVQQPTISIAGDIDPCINECGTFSILITGGTGGTYQLSFNITDGTFNYNFMDPSITNGENINVCYGGATSSYNAATNTLNIPNTVSQGDFIISATLIVDNNFTTCPGIINPPNTVTVSVNSNPSITLSGTAGLCPGECENVSFNIRGGSGLYNVDFLITSPFLVITSAIMHYQLLITLLFATLDFSHPIMLPPILLPFHHLCLLVF
ncbi:MAG: hypothetical protein IPL13_12245 [Saprospiraceae bacterium]|nr:hypothetical protein [Candidatus Brachybacter algidus]